MQDEPSPYLIRSGLGTAVIAESVAVPILLAAIFDHRGPFQWDYGLAAVGCVLVSMMYAGFSLLRMYRRGWYQIPPAFGLLFTCLSLGAAAMAEVGSRIDLGLYKPALLVGVVFIGLMGDRTMRVVVAAVAAALVGVTGWAEGITGRDLVTLVAVWGWAIVAVTWMTDRWCRHLGNEATTRNALQNLGDDLAGHDGLDALADALPAVASVLPSDTILVVASDDSGSLRITASWPAADRHVSVPTAALPALARAHLAGEVVVDGEWCALPIGADGDRQLVMVIHHRRDRQETDVSVRETAAAVAGSFLAMTNRANSVSALRRESRTDALTGLANRRAMLERLADEMERTARIGEPLCIAMIDLDHFKDYNDTHGHVAGDNALRTLAAQIASVMRSHDLAARFGGEEFCAVLPFTGLAGAVAVIEKIRAAVERLDCPTFSAGVAQWDGRASAIGLIDRADAALYRAKAAGRNRVVTAGPGTGNPGTAPGT